jgi:hypothetical protein
MSSIADFFGPSKANAQTPNQQGGLQPQGTDWEKIIVPLLSGIGGMANSNSRYLGAAILQGLGAGANAYENVLTNQAQRGLTGAQTDIGNTVAARNSQLVAQGSMFKGPDNQIYVMTAQGPMLQAYWLQRSLKGEVIPLLGYDQSKALISKIPGASQIGDQNQQNTASRLGAPAPATSTNQNTTQQQVNAPAGGQPATGGQPTAGGQTSNQYRYLGNNGINKISEDANNLLFPTDPNQKTISNNLETTLRDRSQAALNNGKNINQLTSQLLSIGPNDWNHIGPTSPIRNTATNYWNEAVTTALHSIGKDDSINDFKINPSDIGSVEAANKIGSLLKFAQANGANQNSLGALEIASGLVPTPQNTFDGATKILSGMYVDKQQALDMQNYLNEAKTHLMNTQGQAFKNNYLTQNIMDAFKADHPDTEYGQQKEAMRKFLAARMKNGESLFSQYYEKGRNPDEINRLSLTGKMPNLSRYITNN